MLKSCVQACCGANKLASWESQNVVLQCSHQDLMQVIAQLKAVQLFRVPILAHDIACGIVPDEEVAIMITADNIAAVGQHCDGSHS